MVCTSQVLRNVTPDCWSTRAGGLGPYAWRKPLGPGHSSKVSSSICFKSNVSRTWTPTLYRTISLV
jgi:hypothetical protein